MSRTKRAPTPPKDAVPLRTTFSAEEHAAFGELFALSHLIDLAAHGSRKVGDTQTARQLNMLGATVMERIAEIVRTPSQLRFTQDKDVRLFIKEWHVEERAAFNPGPYKAKAARKKR